MTTEQGIIDGAQQVKRVLGGKATEQDMRGYPQ